MQYLFSINLDGHDKIFSHNGPTLVRIGIYSLYCYLLTEEDCRDEGDWAIRLLELQDGSFNLDRVISDDGSGMRSSHKSKEVQHRDSCVYENEGSSVSIIRR